jgi:hypothetical protein
VLEIWQSYNKSDDETTFGDEQTATALEALKNITNTNTENSCILVHRKDWFVDSHMVSRGFAAFIRALESGAPLGDAAELAFMHEDSFDLQESMSFAFLNGLFCPSRMDGI